MTTSCETLRGTLAQAVLDGRVQGSTIVSGGHFMVSNRETLNAGTVESFREAVQTFLALREGDVPVRLGLFINDIGLTCSGGDSCSIAKVRSIGDALAVPAEYQEILAENGLAEEELVLLSERFLRNRAKRIFHHVRKQRADAFVEREEGYYFAPPDRPEIILTRKNAHDQYGTPACPLIMSAFGLELKRMGFDNSVNFYYVGSDNVSNIPNYMPIEKGKLLAHELDPDIRTDNIYLT